MKKLKIPILTFMSITMMLVWHSCNKKEQSPSVPLPGNEPLTTLLIKVVNPNDSADTPTASWVQLDPTGTIAPNLSKDTLILKAGVAYNVSLHFLDTLNDNTSEIQARENYHLVCFGVGSGLNLTCVQTDHDTNPKPLPIGLTDLFTAGSASSGSLEVTLHHQPNVKDGTCEPGSIDLDGTFTVKIH